MCHNDVQGEQITPYKISERTLHKDLRLYIIHLEFHIVGHQNLYHVLKVEYMHVLSRVYHYVNVNFKWSYATTYLHVYVIHC